MDLFEAKLGQLKTGCGVHFRKGTGNECPGGRYSPRTPGLPEVRTMEEERGRKRTKAGKPPDGIQYPLNRFTSRLLSDFNFSTSRPVQLRLNNNNTGNNNNNRHQKNGNPGADPTLRHQTTNGVKLEPKVVTSNA